MARLAQVDSTSSAQTSSPVPVRNDLVESRFSIDLSAAWRPFRPWHRPYRSRQTAPQTYLGCRRVCHEPDHRATCDRRGGSRVSIGVTNTTEPAIEPHSRIVREPRSAGRLGSRPSASSVT